MNCPEHYFDDLLLFFEGWPLELGLYQGLYELLDSARLPGVSVHVQKSQLSFYGRHLFAAASLPLRRKKSWPEHCLVVTVGLNRRLDSPRVAVAVEPYPGRWTHHILVSEPEQLDEELLAWLREAYEFSESKR